MTKNEDLKAVSIKRGDVEKIISSLQDVDCYCDELAVDETCRTCEYKGEAVAILEIALGRK